jgi:hypothetical protein
MPHVPGRASPLKIWSFIMTSPVDLKDQTLITISKERARALPGGRDFLPPEYRGYDTQDELSARVWELIQSPITLKEVLSVISKEYDVGADEGMISLKGLLQELLAAELIEVKGEALQDVL